MPEDDGRGCSNGRQKALAPRPWHFDLDAGPGRHCRVGDPLNAFLSPSSPIAVLPIAVLPIALSPIALSPIALSPIGSLALPLATLSPHLPRGT